MEATPAFLGPRSSSTSIAAVLPTLAVLPIGACEQHGPHLPIGTDAMVAESLADIVSSELAALRLPILAYGTSAEHRGLHGTMSLRPETLAAVVQDIADSCVASGIKRLAILSGHGGNWILRPTIRDINARHQDRTVWLVPESVIWADSFAEDLHAGATETSLMLYLDPDAVGTPPPDFVPDVPREALDLLPIRQLTPHGIWGRPSQASAAMGEDVLNAMAHRIANHLNTTFAALAAQREETLL